MFVKQKKPSGFSSTCPLLSNCSDSRKVCHQHVFKMSNICCGFMTTDVQVKGLIALHKRKTGIHKTEYSIQEDAE